MSNFDDLKPRLQAEKWRNATLPEIIEQFHYKPGWEVSIARDDYGFPEYNIAPGMYQVRIVASNPDSLFPPPPQGWKVPYTVDRNEGLAAYGMGVESPILDRPHYPPHVKTVVTQQLPATLVEEEHAGDFFWLNWLVEQLLILERHEIGEWIRVGDDRPFYPHDGYIK